jgi:ABC-2 type transport system permease protein
MHFLSAALTLARKDLRLFVRDRTGLLLGFLLPTALVTIFGYLMGLMGGDGGGSPMSRATIWVADADATGRSADFVSALRHSDLLRVRQRIDEYGRLIEEAPTAEVLRQQVVDGEIDHALLIEPGFAAAVDSGSPPLLTMVRDPGRQLEDQLAGFGVLQALGEVTGGRVFTGMLASRMREAGLPEVMIVNMQRASEEQPDFDMMSLFRTDGLMTMEDHVPPDRPQDVSFMQAQAVGGIAVMMVLFGLTAVSTTLLREREHGTMRRLLSLPVPPGAILLGKALATGVVGLMQLVVLFLVGELLFKIGIWRDPLTLGVLIVSTVAAATAFGLLIASWARTTKQAEGLSTLIILVMSCLGGSWFPLQVLDLPLPIQVGMRLTINHWSVSGFQGLFWHTQSLADGPIQLSVAVLWLFTAVAAALALRMFRRRYLNRG